MTFWSALMGREPAASAVPAPAPAAARHRFSAIGSDYETWNALVGGTAMAGRVSRAEASRVPAVQRARNLIAGVISTLPLHAYNAAGEIVEHALLNQPESLRGLTRCVTLAKTIEDLLYEAASLWLVVLRSATGFPSVVERVEFGRWSQDDSGKITVNGREVDTADVILFTSPNDPLLTAGAPAIRALIRLEQTAALYAATPQAAEYFTAVDGVDPAEEGEVERLLADWQAARKKSAVAYIPAAVKLNTVDGRLTSEELQLIQAREFAVTEIARLTGIDADWLSVNTTSRTYANITDARRSFVDFTLAPYLHAVEERLSLLDTTPRGQKVRFNLNGFLRASTLDRYNAHSVALSAGFMSVNEIRELENLPPIEGTPLPEGDAE